MPSFGDEVEVEFAEGGTVAVGVVLFVAVDVEAVIRHFVRNYRLKDAFGMDAFHRIFRAIGRDDRNVTRMPPQRANDRLPGARMRPEQSMRVVGIPGDHAVHHGHPPIRSTVKMWAGLIAGSSRTAFPEAPHTWFAPLS